MIEINLVPDVKRELIRARMIRSTVVSVAIIASIISLVVVALIAIYVYAVQTVRSVVADDAIKSGAAQLSKVDDLSKILTIQNQLTKMSALNDEKMIDSRVLDLLQAIIPPAPNEVKVSSLTIDAESGTITFEGQTPTYPSLETFKKTIGAANVRYKDDDDKQVDTVLASDLSISNVSYGQDAQSVNVLRFTVSFTYAPELFSPKTKNPTIVLINGGNVTDSYLGVPKSIFTDAAKTTGGAQ